MALGNKFGYCSRCIRLYINIELYFRPTLLLFYSFFPSHFRKLYEDALRDSTSPAAAAAKCQLMTSRAVVHKPSWITSLGHVRGPTEDALHTCMVCQACQVE